jgi:hypothetical protein
MKASIQSNKSDSQKSGAKMGQNGKKTNKKVKKSTKRENWITIQPQGDVRRSVSWLMGKSIIGVQTTRHGQGTQLLNAKAYQIVIKQKGLRKKRVLRLSSRSQKP